MTPHIPNIATKQMLLVTFTSHPLYTRGNGHRYSPNILGGPPEFAWKTLEKENFLLLSGIKPRFLVNTACCLITMLISCYVSCRLR
jgi:hypothetical protein